jgi:mono/diheme cytochrome c family protein
MGRRQWRGSVLVASAWLVAGCQRESLGVPATKAPGGPVGPAQPTPPGTSTVEATPVWMTSCAPCHGQDGRGNPQLAAMLKVPDLTEPALQARLTDGQIAQVIERGKGKMPPMGMRLSQPKIQLMVGYVRKLRR